MCKCQGFFINQRNFAAKPRNNFFEALEKMLEGLLILFHKEGSYLIKLLHNEVKFRMILFNDYGTIVYKKMSLSFMTPLMKIVIFLRKKLLKYLDNSEIICIFAT